LLVTLSHFPNCAARFQEPSCTYMDNLENLLEKHVRNEHKLGLFGETLKTMETDINTKTKELDNAELNRNKHIQDMQKAIDDMKQTVSEAVNNLQKETDRMISELKTKESERSQTLSDALQKHEVELQSLQENYKTPTVVFTVTGGTNSNIHDGQPIKFKTVVSNMGDGYDSGTGQFTAPYDGLYSFQSTLCSKYQISLFGQLMAAGTTIGSTYTYNKNADGTCSTISGMTTLSKGDMVWIRGTGSSSGAMFVSGSYHWPSFSGMLVHN